jgi:ABC-type uncharacterized transport system involved in gliding motility auxiliary subunit
MRRHATLRTAIGIVLAAILFVSANNLVVRLFGDTGIDLTANGLYTVSPGTRAILHRIDEPVTLKLYFSSRLGQVVPSYGVYAQRVRQLLRTYAAIANGKIRLQILDPVPYSEIEDQATAAGLQGAPVNESGDTVYFGLVGTNSTDDVQTIPFIQKDRETFLEYDLTKMVQALAFPKKKVVGLMSSLQLDSDPMMQMRGQPSNPQAFLDQLRQIYEVRNLPATLDQVPADLDVLIVAQPVNLQPKTQYAIDQYVMGGGHALIFADPYSEFSVSHRNPMQRMAGGASAADFDSLLHAWGVNLLKGKLVGDRLAANKVTFGGDSQEPVDYVLWLSLHGDDINPNDPITGKLTDVNVATSGALEKIPGAKTGFEPLLRSSDDSELIDSARIAGLQVPDAVGLLQDFKPTSRRYTLAARITGPADTAFPGGPPKDSGIKAPQIKTAKAPLDVVVVADTDLLEDRFWIQFQDFAGRSVGTPFAGNGDFVQNAVDSLAGTNDLINLRSRGSAVRPFTLVDRIRREADDRYRAHEKELRDKLKATQAKLASIKAPDESSGAVELTPDQQKAVDQFQRQIIQTRTELRQVQLALRQDIDRLKNWLVLVNVGLVPLLVAAASVLVGVVRARRRRRPVTQ